jgi:hypothetical protein
VWYSLFQKTHLKKLGLGFVQVGLVWHCAKAANARSPPARVELQCQLKNNTNGSSQNMFLDSCYCSNNVYF